jgi:hypothetical protein
MMVPQVRAIAELDENCFASSEAGMAKEEYLSLRHHLFEAKQAAAALRAVRPHM